MLIHVTIFFGDLVLKNFELKISHDFFRNKRLIIFEESLWLQKNCKIFHLIMNIERVVSTKIIIAYERVSMKILM